jgi:hypothetical protein
MAVNASSSGASSGGIVRSTSHKRDDLVVGTSLAAEEARLIHRRCVRRTRHGAHRAGRIDTRGGVTAWAGAVRAAGLAKWRDGYAGQLPPQQQRVLSAAIKNVYLAPTDGTLH